MFIMSYSLQILYSSNFSDKESVGRLLSDSLSVSIFIL